jgi:RNase H-fold protein (predicted Holliday junction resolvase)
MEEIRKFKSQMENEIGLQVTLGNEIFTTSAAKRVQGHHEKIDSSAAALILQTYLDQKWRK